MSKKALLFVLLAVIATGIALSRQNKSPLTLYWFIPDGMRAEPDLFTVYEWAKEGKLPNIKKLMDRGSYGYSYPNFPSHTPTNFATLLTGAYPETHGVNDGPMRVIGKPLNAVAVSGFRSTAKKVAPIWKTLEDHSLKVALISVPGSTPPEIKNGVVLKGRWGGWGPDFFAMNFETKGDLSRKIAQGNASRFFYFGPQLTNYLDDAPATDWKNPPASFSPAREVTMDAWGATIHAYIYDSTDDRTLNYDRVVFSEDKTDLTDAVKPGDWSPWRPIQLTWKSGESPVRIASQVKIGVIKLGNGFFRFRLLFNTLNRYVSYPETAADSMLSAIGPMVDFPDNFPAQLVYYPEDKRTFEDEAAMSFDWHTKAVSAINSLFHPNVVIHDIYTPNQMLTSRWWMGSVDPKSAAYQSVDPKDREILWTQVQDMYKKLDALLGEVIKNSGRNTYIVLSSDHGAVPLNMSVNLNTLFAQKGWLSYSTNPKTGETTIDWKKSKVVYLKMAHVFINPAGLDGDYARASGPAYEKLRDDVVRTLQNLQDKNGVKPVVEIVPWEKAKEFMQMDPDRAGDLVIANAPGYGWNEELPPDGAVFSTPPVSGYKQAIIAKDVPGMWTPFIIAGPGIKKQHFLGKIPFPLVDQYPTILRALHIPIPNTAQGKVLDVFTNE